MASPIRWFRKHAQFFVVIFGVVLIGIFGLGTVFTSLNPSDFISNGDEEANKVVAQWAGGELRKEDLFKLRRNHYATQRLVNHVYQYAVNENGGKQFPVAVPRILPLSRPGSNPTEEQMDEQMMNRFLFAKKAQGEGFIVDERMALDYIAQFGGDVPMSKNMLKQLNNQVNQRMPLTAIVRHVQTELLSQQMESLARGGLPFDDFNPVSAAAINPTEAIQLYARSNKQIECQVLPIPIEEYVSKINEEPSESELKALYEEGKYDYPFYNFKKPGFKKLKQARIQYFVGELDTFLTNEVAKLTDAEVQAEYERLVEAEDDFVMEAIPVEKKEDAADADASQGQASDVDDPAPAPQETMIEEGSMEDADAEDAGDAEDAEPVETPDSEGGQSSVSVAIPQGDKGPNRYTALKKQDDVPVADTPGNPVPQDPSNGLRQEANEAVAPVQDASEVVTESGAVLQADADTTTTEAAGEGVMQAVEAATVDAASDAADATTGGAAADQAASSDEMAQDPALADEPKVERRPKPLVDIAEELKRRMKMEDARIARDAAVDAAEKAVRKYQMKRSKWDYEREQNGEGEELPPPDYNKMADEYQLKFMETDLVDQTQIGDERIGQITTFSFANQQLVQKNVGEQIFEQYEDLSTYQPQTVDDSATRSKVIYWLAEKVDQSVPDFVTARPTVLEYWKRNKGLEAAEAQAQSIVNQLNDSGKLLKDIPEYAEKAQDTGIFSWFSSFGRFAYGQPASVVAPGEEFMSAAFDLKEPGNAAKALNENRDIVYVIQNNSSFDMSIEQLGSDYMSKNFFQAKQIPREVVSAKGMYRRRLNFDWLRELQDDLKVEVVGQ